jgi:hypothetical protein
MATDPRSQILQMIEDGKLSAAEGIRLLNALSGNTEAQTEAHAETPPPPPAPEPAARPEPKAPRPKFGEWRNWWLLPFAVGGGIALVSGLLMWFAWRVAEAQLSVWLILAACPFSFGLLIVVLAFLSRNAKWIHIRINNISGNGPRRIALSFPLPIRLTAWFLRLFSPFIPKLRDTGVDELILALDETTTPDNPFYVEVDEAGGGEKVQVYIG